jgi:NCS2 family nucleobase:cation symporter-2
MRIRPHNLIYAVDDRPAPLILLLQGLQHVSLISVSVLLPLIVAKAAGMAESALPSLISFSLIAIAVATLLQAWRSRAVGAGYLIPGFCSSNYLAASLAAAQAGGMPLVYGMTLLAGLFETALSRLISRLRPYLPPELSGIAIVVIGIDLGVIAFRFITGTPTHSDMSGSAMSPQPMSPGAIPAASLAIGFGTFALSFLLSIYGKGLLRLFCSLIAVIAGYAAALWLGMLPSHGIELVSHAALLDLPQIAHIGFAFAFDPIFVLPFMLAALSSLLKTVGAVTTCQMINDQSWVRPDMVEIQRGVAADGLATISAALMGSTGQNSSTSSVGISSATGATSRWIALPIAGWLLVMACSPKLAALLVAMPEAVMGGTLMFSSCFMLVNGLQVISARMLDTRRTAVVGFSLLLAISSYAFPEFYRSLPSSVQPLFGSALSIGVLSAFLLNLVLRIGVKRRETLIVNQDDDAAVTVSTFLARCGASWGARPLVIQTAGSAAFEVLEAVRPLARAGTPVTIAASFDEFNLALQVRYTGAALDLSQAPPSPEELLENPDRVFELRGALLRHLADRLQTATEAGERQVVALHFQH